MKKNIRFLFVSLGTMLGLTLSIFFSSQAAFAQATTGTLRGTVLDPNGQAVPGASIVAKNQATGVSSPTTTTTESGTFFITNLLPGQYSITVTTNSGFKTATTSDIAVRLGLETDVPVALEVGTASEVVTIVAGADEVAQTSSEISSNYESRKVTDLPSNAAGSGIDTLALNAPGVIPSNLGGTNTNGTALSVNGNRARSNNFTIDGTDNNDLSIGGPSFFVSNQDLVQEFQIVTNNFSAEYGRNQGAVVNIITKAGSNKFSGSAFDFHRNSSSLDAQTNLERRDPTRSRRDKFVSNVFGGTFGGPIVKDKAFFFGSYQGIRQRQSFTARGGNLAILPSEFTRLRAAFPGNNAITALTTQGAFALTNFGTVRPRSDRATDFVCISVNPTANCQVASPTNPNPNRTGFFAAAFPERIFSIPVDQDEYTLRGDINFTPGDNLTVQYLDQDGSTGNGLGGSGGFTGDIPATTRKFIGTYSRQFSSRVVNEFRFTYQNLFVKFGGGCTDSLAGCIIDPDNITEAFTNIQFGGVRGESGTTLQTIGPATNLPQGRTVTVYQFSDKVSTSIDNHQLKFGIDVRVLRNRVPFLPNINGSFRFNTIASLATNTPSSVILADGVAITDFSELDQFYFAQDDWKISRNLSLNLGVRYEFTGQPLNIFNDSSVARESDPAAAFYRQNLPIEARTVPRIAADKNNIAPRLGFAYSPGAKSGFLGTLLGEGLTVIRGGFSIAYDATFYNIALNISSSAPNVFLDTITNAAGIVPLPASPIGTAVRTAGSSFLRRNTFDPRFLTQTQVASDFRSPYSQQYSFGIQRQLNNNNVVEVRYVGTRGKALFQSVNRNANYANLFNGFTANVLTNINGVDVNVPTVFPGFANLLNGAPAPQVCINIASTPDNEAACNGRLLAGRGLIRSRENTASSTYDSLQTRYNGRFLGKNLNLGVSYTLSKGLDNASEIFNFGAESNFAQNPFDIENGERSFSGFDRRHSFALNYTYDVPFLKEQRGFVGKVLGGFQINGTYNLASGQRYTPSQFFNAFGGIPTYEDTGFAGTFLGQDNFRPFLGSRNAPLTSVGITDIDARLLGFTTNVSPTGFFSLNEFNTTGNAVAVTPNDVRFIFNGPGAARLFGTPFGNSPRNSVIGVPLNQLNIGVFKNTKISETIKIQFRVEAFNFLNHPNAGFGVAGESDIPDNIIEDAGISFGDIREIQQSSRRLQFGLRIVF